MTASDPAQPPAGSVAAARGTGEPHRALLIYAELRAMLRDGMFGPGTKLKLRELALEFGTSLTPVRDALSRLVAEQVLESFAEPHGYCANSVSRRCSPDAPDPHGAGRFCRQRGGGAYDGC